MLGRQLPIESLDDLIELGHPAGRYLRVGRIVQARQLRSDGTGQLGGGVLQAEPPQPLLDPPVRVVAAPSRPRSSCPDPGRWSNTPRSAASRMRRSASASQNSIGRSPIGGDRIASAEMPPEALEVSMQQLTRWCHTSPRHKHVREEPSRQIRGAGNRAGRSLPWRLASWPHYRWAALATKRPALSTCCSRLTRIRRTHEGAGSPCRPGGRHIANCQRLLRP